MRRIWIAIAIVAVVIAGGAAAALFAMRQPSGPATPLAGAASPAAGAAPSSAPATQASTQAGALTPDDHILGNREAPVTIIEYASLTCPHCAHFHETTLPRLKTEYIDTGKAKLVYRDFPLDQVALRAAALAECVPADRYFGLLSILFQGQNNWATAPDPNAALARLGKLGGLSDEQVTACMNDEKRIDAVVAERLAGEQQYAIRSTPTFIINGKKYTGAPTFEQMQDSIKSALP